MFLRGCCTDTVVAVCTPTSTTSTRTRSERSCRPFLEALSICSNRSLVWLCSPSTTPPAWTPSPVRWHLTLFTLLTGLVQTFWHETHLPRIPSFLPGSMMVDLEERVSQLESWTDGKGLIVQGAAGTFCSGSDLNAVRAISNPQVGRQIYLQNLFRCSCLNAINPSNPALHLLSTLVFVACVAWISLNN